MDLKVAAAVILFATVTITQGATPKCCVTTPHRVPRRLLVNADKYELQSSHGVCEIEAVILHINGKKYCAPTKVMKFLKQWKKADKEHNEPIRAQEIARPTRP